MPHSCGKYSVEKFLAGKDTGAIQLYEKFSDLIQSCGPVLTAPAKTRVGFQVRMIFAAVNKLSERGLEAHVVLTRRLNSSRFRRIEMLTPRCFVHHFRIDAITDLDEEVRSWLQEAYKVGTQER